MMGSKVENIKLVSVFLSLAILILFFNYITVELIEFNLGHENLSEIISEYAIQDMKEKCVRLLDVRKFLYGWIIIMALIIAHLGIGKTYLNIDKS